MLGYFYFWKHPNKDIPIDDVRSLLPEYHIYQLIVNPEDCGHAGVSRKRTYIYCCHSETCEYLYDVWEDYDEIKKVLCAHARTECADYFVASEQQKTLHTLDICRKRKIEWKGVPCLALVKVFQFVSAQERLRKNWVYIIAAVPTGVYKKAGARIQKQYPFLHFPSLDFKKMRLMRIAATSWTHEKKLLFQNSTMLTGRKEVLVPDVTEKTWYIFWVTTPNSPRHGAPIVGKSLASEGTLGFTFLDKTCSWWHRWISSPPSGGRLNVLQHFQWWSHLYQCLT